MSASKVPATKVKLALGFQWQPQWVPLQYGVEQGIFEKHGISLEIQPTTGPQQALQLVSAGSVDFSMANFEGYVVARSTDQTDTKITYVYEPKSILGIATTSPLKSPADLEGKTYATTSTSNSGTIISTLMKKAGADPSKVNFKQLDFAVLYPSLLQKKIDAAEANTPGSWRGLERTAGKQNLELHHTSLSDWGLDEYTYVMLAQNSTIGSKPELVRSMVAAVDESLKATRSLSGDEVVKILKTQTQVADEEAAKLDWQDFLLVSENAGGVDPARIEAQREFALADDPSVLNSDLNYYYTNDFLP